MNFTCSASVRLLCSLGETGSYPGCKESQANNHEMFFLTHLE